MAKDLTLTEDQIYKWFWDTKKKEVKRGGATPKKTEQTDEGWDSDFETLAIALDLDIEKQA